MIETVPLQFELFDFLDDFMSFTALAILFVGFLGLMSRSFPYASMGGYATFALIATETGDDTLMSVLYASVAVVFMGLGFKLFRLEGVGD